MSCSSEPLRQRIQPHILVPLTIVHRTQAEPALQEKAIGTRRRFLEFGDRERIARRGRVENLPRLRHIPVDHGELPGLTLRFCGSSAPDRREGLLNRRNATAARADDCAQPPAGAGCGGLTFGRKTGDGLAKCALHLLIGSSPLALLQPERLKHQPRGIGLAKFARVSARIAEGRHRSRVRGFAARGFGTGHVRRLFTPACQTA